MQNIDMKRKWNVGFLQKRNRNAETGPGGGGGGTPILKLYGDVSPFRVWFFDCPLINRVSN